MYPAWNHVRKTIADSLSNTLFPSTRTGCVTATNRTGEQLEEFVKACRPSELVIDPYCITPDLPHPSLPRGDVNSGIPSWDYDYYLWWLNKVRLDDIITKQYIPAAEVAKAHGIPLILAPQLHGILYSSTMKYIGQRTPSPSDCVWCKGILGFHLWI
jgi:hypothetical protein